PEAHRWAEEQFQKFRSGGQFVPLAVGQDTVVFPGFDGGAEWGGAAADPETGILYVNANDIPWTGSLAKRSDDRASGRGIYSAQCIFCHRDNLEGSAPTFPSLAGIGDRRSPQQIAAVIRQGKGRMPGFSNLQGDELDALVEFLISGESKEVQTGVPQPPGM